MTRKKSGTPEEPKELQHFPFYRSYYNAFEILDDKQRLSLIDGMTQYAFEGVEYEPPDKETKLAFELIKPNMDTTIKKVLGGAGGGRPPKKQTTAAESDDVDHAAEARRRLYGG